MNVQDVRVAAFTRQRPLVRDQYRPPGSAGQRPSSEGLFRLEMMSRSVRGLARARPLSGHLGRRSLHPAGSLGARSLALRRGHMLPGR